VARGLRRRELLVLVAAALPVARAYGQSSSPADPDGTLQAFADTIIPGRRVDVTESGAAIHPQAIAGVDREPGAVETDALALYHHGKVGFDALQPAFLADLTARAGGDFLGLDFERRVEVCKAGLAFDNPARVLWEAAAAVPFTAFCAAALRPEQIAAKASGYRVMGLPGRSGGYRRSDYSYGKKLARERTTRGYLA
jgi:hypothetical protein